MALATLSDVKRLLKIAVADTSRDADITESLEAAESWVRSRIRRDFVTAAAVTLTFTNVREDEIIALPDDGCTVTEVKVFRFASWDGIVLTADSQYQLIDGRQVQLLPNLAVIPFDGAIASRVPEILEKVTIIYSCTPVVPEAVREATAILAGALYTKGPDAAQGIDSESLGDYSYTSTNEQDGLVPDAVTTLLSPFARPRIRST